MLYFLEREKNTLKKKVQKSIYIYKYKKVLREKSAIKVQKSTKKHSILFIYFFTFL